VDQEGSGEPAQTRVLPIIVPRDGDNRQRDTYAARIADWRSRDARSLITEIT